MPCCVFCPLWREHPNVAADLTAPHASDLGKPRAGQQQQLDRGSGRITDSVARPPQLFDLAIVQDPIACPLLARRLDAGAWARADHIALAQPAEEPARV